MKKEGKGSSPRFGILERARKFYFGLVPISIYGKSVLNDLCYYYFLNIIPIQNWIKLKHKIIILTTQIFKLLIFFAVIEMMKMDPDIMIYSLWVLTVIGVLAGLIMTMAAAVFAVINSAITPISALAGIPGLYFWNISASKCNASAHFCICIFLVFS